MKHRRIRPRTDIPDWRDPNMPVQREYVKGNGEKLGPLIDPEFERKFRECKMIITEFEPSLPNWRNDPTYYGKKSNENRRLSTFTDSWTEGLDLLRDQLSRIQTKSS